MCTYNGERFIEEQVTSIFSQSLAPTEIIVCDDGSSDGTVAALERLAALAPPGISLRIAATNRVGGVTPNFERAVRACTGDVIVLCDQDDVWHEDRLRAIAPFFDGGMAPVLVFADAVLIDDRGAEVGASLHRNLHMRREERRDIDRGHAFDALIRRNLITGAATAFSRPLVELAGPFPSSWVHDEWLGLIAAAVGRVVRIPNRLIDYRLHGNNQIGVSDPSTTSRVGRMLSPRGERYSLLGVRAHALVRRLEEIDADPRLIGLAQRKAAFEDIRAGYPESRLRRIRLVLREAMRGEYATLSSQRLFDVVRDLLQPA